MGGVPRTRYRENVHIEERRRRALKASHAFRREWLRVISALRSLAFTGSLRASGGDRRQPGGKDTGFKEWGGIGQEFLVTTAHPLEGCRNSAVLRADFLEGIKTPETPRRAENGGYDYPYDVQNRRQKGVRICPKSADNTRQNLPPQGYKI